MLVHIYLMEYTSYLPIRVDDKRLPLGESTFGIQSAKGFGNYLIAIAQKLILESKLFLESLLRFNIVNANANNSSAHLLNIIMAVTQHGGFSRSASSKRFYVEKHDNPGTSQIGQLQVFVVSCGSLNIRRGRSGL